MKMISPNIYFGLGDSPAAAPAMATDAGKIERAGALKVVIVEDEVMVAWFLESLLLDMELEVAEIFSTGESALAAADRHAPDLIIMDINLGDGIDGVEAAVRLRQKRAVPVIFFSAYADETVCARISRDIPDARLLTKPAAPWQLQKTIESILRIHP